MDNFKCEQLYLNAKPSWSLAKKNACHISVTNSEMGQLRDIQKDMSWKVDGIFTFNGLIIACIIPLVIKKMWGNGNNKKT